MDQIIQQIREDGFTIVAGVFTHHQVETMLDGLEGVFQKQAEASAIRSDAGSVYAARNILELWPDAATVWRQSPLPKILAGLLGPGFGLVRGLFFDKPPERTWALPWHKDLTIAVRDHRLPSKLFTKPTTKAGVPHVEAPLVVLEQMATIRIHLDDVTEENGPLKVVPGSHKSGKKLEIGDILPQSILAERGDVLLMRPLLAHSSGTSRDGTLMHRRILHLEFAATEKLADGYRWWEFRRGNQSPFSFRSEFGSSSTQGVW